MSHRCVLLFHFPLHTIHALIVNHGVRTQEDVGLLMLRWIEDGTLKVIGGITEGLMLITTVFWRRRSQPLDSCCRRSNPLMYLLPLPSHDVDVVQDRANTAWI